MRFRATPSMMTSLEGLGDPLSNADGLKALNEPISDDGEYDAVDQSRLRWVDVYHLADPDYFSLFTGDTSPWIWNCTMVIDRRDHQVFIAASGS
jgi:hypothetical protein